MYLINTCYLSGHDFSRKIPYFMLIFSLLFPLIHSYVSNGPLLLCHLKEMRSWLRVSTVKRTDKKLQCEEMGGKRELT